mmetsp:Transcript_7161/g.12016  ORF Transcript_7161/g.12016 Transcript_7161/m.12016 type:complete len:158 (+) Transcript_7161:143-616(+)
MTYDATVQQFDACIQSLEKVIALLEGGNCDEVALQTLSAHPIDPEFMKTVGKFCTFPDLSDYIPSSSSQRVSDSPINEKEVEEDKDEKDEKYENDDEKVAAEKDKPKERGRGRPSKKRKMSVSSEDAPSSPAPPTPTPTSSTAAAGTPRRSKRAKKD